MRPEHGAAACEVTQTVYDKAQAVAQTALGRPGRGEAMRLTVLVPVNVTLGTPPRLVGAENEPAVPIDLAAPLRPGRLPRRHVDRRGPARAPARADRERAGTVPGRRGPRGEPVRPRGLGQALDALAKEG